MTQKVTTRTQEGLQKARDRAELLAIRTQLEVPARLEQAKASARQLKEKLPENAGRRVTAGALVVGSVAAPLVAVNYEPSYTAPTFPISGSPFCDEVEIEPNVIQGKLEDGRTWRAVLSEASSQPAASLDPAGLCLVAESARADALPRLDWLASPAASEAEREDRNAARWAIDQDRVTLAAANLVVLEHTLDAPALSPTTLGNTVTEQRRALAAAIEKKDWPAVVAAYQALDATRAQASEAAASLSGADVAGERAILERGIYDPKKHPELVAGGRNDALLERTEDVTDESADARAAELERIAGRANDGLGTAVDALVRASAPTWSADHPDGTPPANYREMVREGLQAGGGLGDFGPAIEKHYRNQPGVADKHLPTFIQQGVQAAYDREIGGGKPSDEAVAQARAMFLDGASVQSIYDATANSLRGTREWRQHIINQNLGQYYPQPYNWSCSAASAVNVLALLGVEAPSHGLQQHFIDRMGVSPNGGLLWGGTPRIGENVVAYAAEHGVRLTGYNGTSYRDLSGINQALADGHVVIVSGGVVRNGQPSNAGHFLVIKKLNPDGTYVMADPWTPEFANRTITQSEFMPFVSGPKGSRFFAVARAP